MTATLSFKIRTLRHQIRVCMEAVMNGLRSFVDRLIILEGQLERLMATVQQQEQQFIKLTSNRSKGINAYLVREGLDHTHNDYGTPLDENEKDKAHRKKRHVVKVRIDHLKDGIYRYVECGGADFNKREVGYLKIANGDIVDESENVNDLILGDVAKTLPELEGSTGQVSWAESIREAAIAKFIKMGKEVPQVLTKTTSAKWFIDNKDKLK